MRIPLAPLVAVGAILGGLDVARAQTPGGDPAAGHQVAQKWCSSCHAVEPMRQQKSTDVAPSFSAIANTSSTNSTALHVFLQTPHGQMPDFALSRVQIDDVVAYVLSLRAR
jgi:mono/diheme cytochrome c family protein